MRSLAKIGQGDIVPHARSAHIDDSSARHLHETSAPRWSSRRCRRIVVTEASDFDQQSFAAARAEFDDARSFRARAHDLVHQAHRISKLSALLATGTLLKFHKALVDDKS